MAWLNLISYKWVPFWHSLPFFLYLRHGFHSESEELQDKIWNQNLEILHWFRKHSITIWFFWKSSFQSKKNLVRHSVHIFARVCPGPPSPALTVHGPASSLPHYITFISKPNNYNSNILQILWHFSLELAASN